MKTTMKQLTAGTFIALLLLVGNVNANGTDVKASGHEKIETALQIEKWMLNEVIWNIATTTISTIFQESEKSLEIETWMTSEKTWNVEKAEVENELAVEGWMINSRVWN